MRKLKLQVQMTVDGYVAGPTGEVDWMVWNWDDELKNYTSELTESIDTVLLGRKMADGFISHWKAVAANPNDSDQPWGKKFTDTPKIVFTKTLEKSEWPNTELAKETLADEIEKLKNQDGKDLIVYGGATFVSSLIKERLIRVLFIHKSSSARKRYDHL
jgi:dihydrofolate reductase